MEISASLIILIINLAFILIVLLGFLGGVMKGFYKSSIFLAFSAVFFIVGVLLIPAISNALMGMNVSFLEGLLPGDANVEITSIKESLPAILQSYFPDQASLFVEGTETMALAYGLVNLFFRLIILVALLLLNATIFKLFPFILWMFIKPKRNPLTNEKPKKHRLLGGAVGAVKGVAASLLLAFPLAGVASFANSAEKVYGVMDQATATSEGAIISLAEGDEEEDNIKMIIDMATAYRKSIMGVIFGIDIGGHYLDEIIFDSVYKIEVKTETTKQDIHIRRDAKKLTKIAEIVLEANDGETDFDLSYLFKITEADLNKIQSEIKGLSITNVLKNVGAELGYDYIQREGLNQDYEDIINLEALKGIDINEELNTIIDAVIIISESEAQEEVFENVFALTKEEADEVFEKLSELKIIQMGLPLGFNFLINMEAAQTAMEEYNLSFDDIQKPSQADLISDFKNIVNIYIVAKDMGFETTEQISELDLDIVIQIEDVQIVELFNVVFDFTFLYNNDEVFASLVYDFAIAGLDEEYKNIVTKDVLVENFNAGELSSIALLGKLLYVEELFEEDTPIDYVKLLRNENVDKISSYISGSNILSEGMEGVLVFFTNSPEFDFEIIVPADYSFKGSPGKTEITAILLGIRNIFEVGMLDEGFDFATMTNAKIDELAENFSNSDIIKYNLSPLINQLTAPTDYAFITSDEGPSFWTKAEIAYTLKAVKIFAEEEISELSIHTLEADKVDEIAKSKTIANSIAKFINHEIEPGGQLDGMLVVPDNLVYHSTETEHGEIYYMLVGLQEIIGDDSLDGFEIELSDVVDMDVNLIFESKILEATVVEKQLKTMADEPHIGKFIVDKYEDGDEFDWYIGENPSNPRGDSIPLIESLTILDELGIGYDTINYNDFIVVLTANPDDSQTITDAIIDSRILNASLPKMLEELINVQGGLNLDIYEGYKNDGIDLPYWGEEGVNKELFYILDALVGADQLEDFDYASLNSSNKEDFKTIAKDINKSETLRQMLPRIILESNLSKANDLRSDKNPEELTEAEWNNEIDVLVDIIVKLNEYPDLDFNNPTPGDLIIIAEIRTMMIPSLLYDETKIPII